MNDIKPEQVQVPVVVRFAQGLLIFWLVGILFRINETFRDPYSILKALLFIGAAILLLIALQKKAKIAKIMFVLLFAAVGFGLLYFVTDMYLLLKRFDIVEWLLYGSFGVLGGWFLYLAISLAFGRASHRYFQSGNAPKSS